MSDLLARGLRWLVRKAGLETLFFFGILLTILWATLNSLEQIVRGFDPGLMSGTGVLGLLCGWLLARSRLRPSRALVAGVLFGTGWVFWQVGHLGLPAWEALLESSRYFVNWLSWRPGLPAPPAEGLLMAYSTFISGSIVLVQRAAAWAGSALAGSAVFDPVAATLVWGLAFWLVNVWASWAIRRWRKPLWAVVPGASLVGLSLAAAGGPTLSLLIILASTLAMLGWNGYHQQEAHWNQSKIDYSEDLRLDTALALITLILCLTSIAAISPSVSLQKLADWTDRLSTTWGHPNRPARPGSGSQGLGVVSTREPGLSFGESLGLAPDTQALKPTELDELRASGGLPQEHLLGSGPELSDQIVLSVQDEASGEFLVPPRYYWRAVTYNRYSGVGWATGPTQTIEYSADDRSLAGGLDAQVLIRQEIQVLGDAFGGGSILFNPGELLAVDQEYQVAWRHRPDDPLDGTDQYGALAIPADRPPRSYRIEALVTQASQEQLRQAGSRYPDWVVADGLSLPDSVPDRVRDLALELTAIQPTPYDRAVAIEAYLRTYPYTLDLDEPPGDRDLVDYFLFDLKKGYCDYYASSMVVLARAAGIPARLAVGYVGGTYDQESERYQVSAAEAHSWPELFFPNYGWVGFEPTAGRSALERSDQTTSSQPPDFSGERANFIWRVDWLRLGYAALALLAVLLLGLLVRVAAESWWLGRLPSSMALLQIYRRLYYSGKRLQVDTHPGDTPGEFGEILHHRLRQIIPGKASTAEGDHTGQQIQALVQAYSRLVYSPQAPDEALKQQAIRDWLEVRRRLWRARMAKLVSRFSNRLDNINSKN